MTLPTLHQALHLTTRSPGTVMSTMVRNVSVQHGQTQVVPRPQGALFAPSTVGTPVNRAATSTSQALSASQSRNQRTGSPKAWTAGAEKAPVPKNTPGPGAVRSASGSQNVLSPPPSALASRDHMQRVEVETAAGLHCDCSTCMDTRRRGFVLCRLPCGHTVRAAVVESELPAGCLGNGSGAAAGARSESPPLLSAQQREWDQNLTSPPPRSIMRQVSGIRNPVPSVGILAPLGQSSHPPAPLSPPRGPASPSSPQQTLGTMYRKATSSLTSFNIHRESSGQPPNVEVYPAQQMTSRSSGGGGVLGGSSQGGVGPDRMTSGQLPSREASTREKGRQSRDSRELVRTEPFAPEARRSVDRQHLSSMDTSSGGGPSSTIVEVITDSRGDVLHRNTNVILLSPQSSDREQQLKVRGQIIGTYWDERDIGPTLDHPGEVQVNVTYVDASERSAPLLFATKYAQTFGDTETTEGNIIKWKAALCKVGKKFS